MDDDPFDAIISEMGEDFLADLHGREPQDYQHLSDLELTRQWLKTKQDLLNRGVLLHPSEEDDIDMQANYYGMLQEMNRRRLR